MTLGENSLSPLEPWHAAWLIRNLDEHLGNAILIFCLTSPQSKPGFFLLYPWIYSSSQTSITWERQRGNDRCFMLEMIFCRESNWLHILPTGLPLASYHDDIPFYFSPSHRLLVGCTSDNSFRGSKQVFEMKDLDLRGFWSVSLVSGSQFPLHLKRMLSWWWYPSLRVYLQMRLPEVGNIYYILIPWCGCG